MCGQGETFTIPPERAIATFLMTLLSCSILQVVLVKHKSTQTIYAMKAIVKKHVIAHSELKHTLVGNRFFCAFAYSR